MNGHEFITAIQPFVDRYGFVKPDRSGDESGNPMTYNTVFMLLMSQVDPSLIDPIWYTQSIAKLMPNNSPGLLWRTPMNGFGQNSIDEYLSTVVGCLLIGNTEIPRNIFWHGVRNVGFYNNEPNFNWAAFLWRFPQLQVLLLQAAFPWLRKPLRPVMSAVGYFGMPDPNNGSGVQLAWIYYWGEKICGMKNLDNFEKVCKMLPAAMDQYYPDESMPFRTIARELYA